jgi:diguanylate cyclase (GGDEF)-like protein
VSIRTKVFFIIFVLFALLGGANFLIQRFIIYPSFLQLEYNEAGENMKRIFSAIDRETVYLDKLCVDWAEWNDTYLFMEQQSKEFIVNNLNKEYLVGELKLNLMLYCKPDGTIVWEHAMSLGEKKQLIFEFMSTGKIPPSHPLLNVQNLDGEGKGKYGVFASQFGPLLFSSRQILRSDGSGPGNGFLIVGRILDKAMQETLREQTRIPFDVVKHLLAAGSLCGAEEAKNVQIGDLSFSVLQNEEYIKACAPYRDASGQPLFDVQYLLPREITRKGIASMRYAAVLVIVSGVVILFILVVLLQQIILRPLRLLTKHASRLELEGDYSVRFKLDRGDEIGSLANSFDSMVQTIRQRQEELKLANEQLTQMSMLDGLTGVANRRWFDLEIKKEWRSAMRTQEPLSLVILDVDFFKNYNDNYGHLRGDECLTAVASALQQQVHRTSDLLARYGGEEFVMLLPNTHAEGAMMLAENARLAVEELKIEHSGSKVSSFVSISLGVVTMVPQIDHGNLGLDSLLEKADLALYQAKNQGRNRAVFSS